MKIESVWRRLLWVLAVSALLSWPILTSSLLWCPFILRVINVTVVREREREIDLLATQRRTVLFAELTVTSHPLLYLCTFHLTWSADLLRSLIRVNIILAEIFRASSPRKLETFNRTSGLQISLALGLQKLQVLNVGDVHQNFCLQNLQVLDQKHNLQRLGLVHQNFLSRVFRSFLANLQNMLTLMIF